MSANIAETFELLFDKNNNVAYKALQELQKANYAVRMYQKTGFEIVDENEEEYIMLRRL